MNNIQTGGETSCDASASLLEARFEKLILCGYGLMLVGVSGMLVMAFA